MNNEEIIKELSNEIVKRLENEYGFSDIKGNIEGFINQNLDEIKKLQVLQILYSFTLYRNAYIAIDPRVREKNIFKIKSVLNIKTESDFEEKIKQATESLKKFEDAEKNPIQTIRKKIDDKKNSNYVF